MADETLNNQNVNAAPMPQIQETGTDDGYEYEYIEVAEGEELPTDGEYEYEYVEVPVEEATSSITEEEVVPMMAEEGVVSEMAEVAEAAAETGVSVGETVSEIQVVEESFPEVDTVTISEDAVGFPKEDKPKNVVAMPPSDVADEPSHTFVESLPASDEEKKVLEVGDFDEAIASLQARQATEIQEENKGGIVTEGEKTISADANNILAEVSESNPVQENESVPELLGETVKGNLEKEDNGLLELEQGEQSLNDMLVDVSDKVSVVASEEEVDLEKELFNASAPSEINQVPFEAAEAEVSEEYAEVVPEDVGTAGSEDQVWFNDTLSERNETPEAERVQAEVHEQPVSVPETKEEVSTEPEPQAGIREEVNAEPELQAEVSEEYAEVVPEDVGTAGSEDQVWFNDTLSERNETPEAERVQAEVHEQPVSVPETKEEVSTEPEPQAEIKEEVNAEPEPQAEVSEEYAEISFEQPEEVQEPEIQEAVSLAVDGENDVYSPEPEINSREENILSEEPLLVNPERDGAENIGANLNNQENEVPALQVEEENSSYQILPLDTENDVLALEGMKHFNKSSGMQTFSGSGNSGQVIIDYEAGELDEWSLIVLKKFFVKLSDQTNSVNLPKSTQTVRYAVLLKSGCKKLDVFDEESVTISPQNSDFVQASAGMVYGDTGNDSEMIIEDFENISLAEKAGSRIVFDEPVSAILCGGGKAKLYAANLREVIIPSETQISEDAAKQSARSSKWYSGSLNDKYFELTAANSAAEFNGTDEVKSIHVNVGTSAYGWNVTFDNGLVMSLRDLQEFENKHGAMPSKNGTLSHGALRCKFSNIEKIVVYEQPQYFAYGRN